MKWFIQMALFVIISPTILNAQIYTWTGTTDSLWTNGSNWDQGNPPEQFSRVIINHSVPHTPVLSGTDTIGNLQIYSTSQLKIDSLGSLLILGDGLELFGTLMNLGDLEIRGGDVGIHMTGNSLLNNFGNITLDSIALNSINLYTGTFNNFGTIEISNINGYTNSGRGINISFGNFINKSLGLVNIDSTNWNAIELQYSQGQFLNQGTLILKTGIENAGIFNKGLFENDSLGIITTSKSIVNEKDMNNFGIITFDSTTLYNDKNFTNNGLININTAESIGISNSEYGESNFINNGNIQINKGCSLYGIYNRGYFTIDTSGVLNIDSTEMIGFRNDYSFNVYGQLNISGADSIGVNNYSYIEFHDSAQVNILNSRSIGINIINDPFINRGQLKILSESGLPMDIKYNERFTNSGILQTSGEVSSYSNYSFLHYGTLEIGDSIGQIEFINVPNFQSYCETKIDIQGTNGPGQLNGNDYIKSERIGGQLQINLIDGFIPQSTDTFLIVSHPNLYQYSNFHIPSINPSIPNLGVEYIRTDTSISLVFASCDTISTKIWAGGSGDWNNVNKWKFQCPPDSGDVVIIPISSGAGAHPSIVNTTVNLESLTITSNPSFTNTIPSLTIDSTSELIINGGAGLKSANRIINYGSIKIQNCTNGLIMQGISTLDHAQLSNGGKIEIFNTTNGPAFYNASVKFVNSDTLIVLNNQGDGIVDDAEIENRGYILCQENNGDEITITSNHFYNRAGPFSNGFIDLHGSIGGAKFLINDSHIRIAGDEIGILDFGNSKLISSNNYYDDATLEFDIHGISGSGLPSGHDQIINGATNVFNGDIIVRIDTSSFLPQSQDSFTLIKSSYTGNFDNLLVDFELGNWDLVYMTDSVVVIYNPKCNNIINVNDNGPGSLRNAIACVNNGSANMDSIYFNIPGPGPHVILLQTILEDLTKDSLIIDGTTQSGNYPMQGKITLDMTAINSPHNGLRVAAENVEIYGLTFANGDHTPSNAIFVNSGKNDLTIGDSLKGNWMIGPNLNSGIYIKENTYRASISNNIIGNDSASITNGIVLTSGVVDTKVQNNDIESCSSNGILLYNFANDNLIESNLFSGNTIGINNNANIYNSSHFNFGNHFIQNKFQCNSTPIQNSLNANDYINSPTILHATEDGIVSRGIAFSEVQYFKSDTSTCENGIPCQGFEFIGISVSDSSGFALLDASMFQSSVQIGNELIAIQSNNQNSSSEFSDCFTVESCSNMVFTPFNTGSGSLRKAISCASIGDTIFFSEHLDSIDIMISNTPISLSDTLAIWANNSSQISLLGINTAQLFDIQNGADVIFRNLSFSNSGNLSYVVIQNQGILNLQNCTITEKSNQNSILNLGQLEIEGSLEILKNQ